jgi:hypothetical protein
MKGASHETGIWEHISGSKWLFGWDYSEDLDNDCCEIHNGSER